MGTWVLIIVTLSGAFSPLLGVQPIYFHTKEACDAVAAEFNEGAEPTKDTPRNKQKSFGAICRATGAR